MLLRYSVSNFLSFKKMNTLQMIAGKSEGFREQTFRDIDNNISILKSGVIYGANASGKSNFIKSIDFAKALIIGGLERVNTFDKNFRLDEEYRKKPSLFQFEIKIGEKYYDYGFSIILNSKKIVEEWLYEKKVNDEERCIFYRKDNKILERIKLNESNESKFNIYISDIKDDIFILKEFSLKKWEENELDSIKNIFTWFVKNLEVIFPDDREGIFYFMNKYKELENYLADFDTGIEVVDLQEKD
ncbi:MAG: AAA family ATPase, partial [Fusobacteriaceae bacterium]